MTDTMTLRDHSQPCEHTDRAYQAEGHWFCFARCPGGREIVLQQAYGKWEPENVKSLKIWIEVVEVDDE